MSMVTEPPLEAEGPARETVAAYARRWWTDVKAGELGSLPIIVGLIVICIVFQTQNDRFLTAGNFVNLIVQTAPYAVIAMGVTFALLLGEIDLSIGFVSGVGGVLVALLLAPDGNEMATAPAIALALLAGLGIGLLHGLIITKVGVPSFVVTLAGLLAWNGVVLLLIGSRGTVILQNDFVVGLANDFMDPGLAWVLWAATIAIYAVIHVLRIRSRKKAGLANDPWVIEVLRIGGLAARAGDRDRRRQPGPRRPVRGHPRRRAADLLDLRPEPDEVRAPRVRGRRQRRGRAARGHQRGPGEDRLLHGCARSWRCSAASSSPRACAPSTRTRAAARRCCTRSRRPSSAARRCSAGAAR